MIALLGGALITLGLILPGSLLQRPDPHFPNDDLRVYGSYLASGEAAAAGLNPYTPHRHTWVFEHKGQWIVDIDLNPPTVLPLFEIFTRFDPHAGAVAWKIISALGYVLIIAGVVAARAGEVQLRQLLWAFATPALCDTLMLGQIYVLLLALSVAGSLLLERKRPIAGGIALGLLVALKPSFAFVPMILLLARHWRAAASTLATAGAVALAALVAYGPAIYLDWLLAAGSDTHFLVPTDASLFGYFARLGLPAIGFAAAALAVGTASLIACRRRPAAAEAAQIGAALAVVAAPLAWVHYTMLLAPALLGRPWGWAMNVGAALLCLPIIVPFDAIGGPAWELATRGGVYTLGSALVLFELMRRSVPLDIAAEDRQRVLPGVVVVQAESDLRIAA